MKINIAENIKTLRKERHLTQENLAEAFNVSIGAVSKWELGLSIPDILTIVDMAAFFQVSVDALLGYEWRTGDMRQTMATIKELRNEKKFEEASDLAEKALQKWPNFFDVVYPCSILYIMKAVESKDIKSEKRAMDLLERSLQLIGQNTNEMISEWTIKNEIGEMTISMGDVDKGIELLKKNNADGLNDSIIGYTLSKNPDKADEALDHLNDALVRNVSGLLRITVGLANAFESKSDYKSAMEIIRWSADLFNELRIPEKVSYLDKVMAQIYSSMATFTIDVEGRQKAQEELKKALWFARRFDQNPIFSFNDIKFVVAGKKFTAFDDFGLTAIEGIDQCVADDKRNSKVLTEIWNTIKDTSK